MTDPRTNDRDLLKQALQTTPRCVPVERFGDLLTAAEQSHVRACPRCQTELALFRQFMDAVPVEDEGAAVQWIAQDLRRRADAPQGQRPPARSVGSWWTYLTRWSVLPLAAGLLLVASVGYLSWDREPAVRSPIDAASVYRTQNLQVVAPVGDQSATPSTFEWVSIPDVVQYDVSLSEVDGTVIWQASVRDTRVAPPVSIQTLMVPGKTLLWKVIARGAGGTPVAESAPQRFRVTF